MAVRKILITSNKGGKVMYKPKTTEIASREQFGVCRTMVLTWIREAQMGVRMNAMDGVLTGGGLAQIEFRHRSTKIRMGVAHGDEDAKKAVAQDVLHGFSLESIGEPLEFQTSLIGITLDPDQMEGNEEGYAMLTLWGDSGHALGLAFNVGQHHYFLDPNTGLFEYDTLDDMLGVLGHVTNYVVTNYSLRYPAAILEQYKLIE